MTNAPITPAFRLPIDSSKMAFFFSIKGPYLVSTRSSPQPNPTQAEQRTEIILDSDECMLYDAYTSKILDP